MTKRCANARKRLLGELDELRAHPDYRTIADITHHLLNLAAFRSQIADEKGAMAIEKTIKRALKKLSTTKALHDARTVFLLE